MTTERPSEINSIGPSFSVIMPTYNRADFLEKAIDSFLAQTYQNAELIIIDDGSTDDTESIVRTRYVNELGGGGIKYIKSEHVGVCKARNIGLAIAQNDWIAYLDSDNRLYPHFLETYAEAIANHTNQTFYALRDLEVGQEGIVQPFDWFRLFAGNYIDMGVFVHARRLYKMLGGFDENMTRCVDWELILRYTQNFTPFCIEKAVFLYNNGEHLRISNKDSYAENLKYIHEKYQTWVKRYRSPWEDSQISGIAQDIMSRPKYCRHYWKYRILSELVWGECKKKYKAKKQYAKAKLDFIRNFAI